MPARPTPTCPATPELPFSSALLEASGQPDREAAGQPAAVADQPLEVEVIRRPNRRKTVQANMVDGRMRLLIPARMSRAEEQHWIEVMRRRFERRASTDRIDLTTRATRLAARHALPRPRVIRWVDNQRMRWGSCTPAHSEIRISSRLAAFPDWVVDYVIVHELAHLVEIGHTATFHALVDRYPLVERAKGYLIAKSIDPDELDG